MHPDGHVENAGLGFTSAAITATHAAFVFRGVGVKYVVTTDMLKQYKLLVTRCSNSCTKEYFISPNCVRLTVIGTVKVVEFSATMRLCRLHVNHSYFPRCLIGEHRIIYIVVLLFLH